MYSGKSDDSDETFATLSLGTATPRALNEDAELSALRSTISRVQARKQAVEEVSVDEAIERSPSPPLAQA